MKIQIEMFMDIVTHKFFEVLLPKRRDKEGTDTFWTINDPPVLQGLK